VSKIAGFQSWMVPGELPDTDRYGGTALAS